MKKGMVVILVPLVCFVLLVMLCTKGCEWLNGDRGDLSADCHELTLSNVFMTINDTEYSLTTNNIPFTFVLKRSNTWYKFGFRLSNDSALRVEIAGVEFAFTNHVATMRGGNMAGMREIKHFKNGMGFNDGWVGFDIRNSEFVFRAASPSDLSTPSYVWYCPTDAEEAPRTVPFRILECAGVKVRHLPNWYEW